MNWKLKAHALALLSRVPAGRRLYHVLQYCLGTNRLDANRDVRRALEIVDLIRDTGKDPRGGIFLEIGTGWRPFLPFILYLIGAERVITVDVNRWLNRRYALETYRALEGQLDEVAQRCAIEVHDMATRYKRAGARRETVEQLLRGFRVEYRCPADAQHTALPDASVDFVCSSNVLEHIPPRVLQNIHRETCRILKPRGLAVHRVNPGDHFTAIDPSITEANFLRYSAKEWRRYSGSPLAYHNRLRCIQHRRLIEESGFSILVDRVRTSQRALEAIRSGRLPIHPSFAQFEAEQLAADYLWIVGERRAMRSLHQRVA